MLVVGMAKYVVDVVEVVDGEWTLVVCFELGTELELLLEGDEIMEVDGVCIIVVGCDFVEELEVLD